MARASKRGNGKGSKSRRQAARRPRVRYAVIGQGHFAQTAILPAFENAEENSELVALFSGDEGKLRSLARKHGVAFALPYDECEDFLKSGEVDAVYIALPNHLHREYTLMAARAGVHVLCEKPMAVSSEDCDEMIRACEENAVKLMVAYRLHFDPANLAAVQFIEAQKLGEPRLMSSVFSLQVQEDNIRTNPRDMGGGPLYDIGIYCINAARYLFQDEPTEVVATIGHKREKRFADVEEQVSAVLKFPGERLATFSASFGAMDQSSYTVVGTKGQLQLSPAYDYALDMTLETQIGKKVKSRVYEKHDQIAPELVYFSRCIHEDREPEPSGLEGLADVRIIEAIYRSADSGQRVSVEPVSKTQRPRPEQKMRKPPAEEPEAVGAEAPGGED